LRASSGTLLKQQRCWKGSTAARTARGAATQVRCEPIGVAKSDRFLRHASQQIGRSPCPARSKTDVSRPRKDSGTFPDEEFTLYAVPALGAVDALFLQEHPPPETTPSPISESPLPAATLTSVPGLLGVRGKNPAAARAGITQRRGSTGSSK
jgi:hypothetical protein